MSPQDPASAPATARHTTATITDDALDELYARAEQAAAAIDRVRYLCGITIAMSVRADAVQQARDTLTALAEPTEPARA